MVAKVPSFLSASRVLVDLVHELFVVLLHDQRDALGKNLFTADDARVGVLLQGFHDGELVGDRGVDLLGLERGIGFRIGLVGLDFLDAQDFLGGIVIAGGQLHADCFALERCHGQRAVFRGGNLAAGAIVRAGEIDCLWRVPWCSRVKRWRSRSGPGGPQPVGRQTERRATQVSTPFSWRALRQRQLHSQSALNPRSS